MADFINNAHYHKRTVDRSKDNSYPRVKANPDKKFIHPVTGKFVYKSKHPYTAPKADEYNEFYGYF